jgi:hypothetical protein
MPGLDRVRLACENPDVMDEPPPPYELSHEVCWGETRECGRGDMACSQKAEKDGYVAVSRSSFCRREEVHTVPRPAGAALLIALLAAGGVVLWRVRRARAS